MGAGRPVYGTHCNFLEIVISLLHGHGASGHAVASKPAWPRPAQDFQKQISGAHTFLPLLPLCHIKGPSTFSRSLHGSKFLSPLPWSFCLFIGSAAGLSGLDWLIS